MGIFVKFVRKVIFGLLKRLFKRFIKELFDDGGCNDEEDSADDS